MALTINAVKTQNRERNHIKHQYDGDVVNCERIHRLGGDLAGLSARWELDDGQNLTCDYHTKSVHSLLGKTVGSEENALGAPTSFDFAVLDYVRDHGRHEGGSRNDQSHFHCVEHDEGPEQHVGAVLRKEIKEP